METGNKKNLCTDKSEWEKIKHKKIVEITKVLEGLNVWQAKKIMECVPYSIEANSIINLEL